ncbi:MAG: porin [Desulfobacterales bacterium]|nr:porin [Desulfobacterales bacterium]
MKKLLVLFVAAMMIAAAGSASASDVSLYGSARMATFWEDYSEEIIGNTDGDSDLLWDLQGNSRFGAKFKGEKINGRVEVALNGANDGKAVETRHIYGTYNFGAGELLVGQTYTPVDDAYSGQVWGEDLALEGFGDLQPGRKPMIQMTFDNFKLAFVSPDADGTADDTVDVTIPLVEASYTMDMSNFGIDLYGGYQTYEETFGTKDMDVDSYVFAVGARADLDPMYVKAKISFGQNLGNYGGMDSTYNETYSTFDGVNDEDSENMGVVGVAGFKVNDKTNIEAGIGYAKDERGNNEEEENMSYYLQAKFSILKNFRITPEIGFLDFDEDVAGTDQGDILYVGAQWRIDF